jgi:2-polyprenyl-3-methyl-5-hydroxy-6-metoxy-1,4-benzoquinol methylase
MRTESYHKLIQDWINVTQIDSIIEDSFIFEPNQVRTILDVGCGDCYLSEALVYSNEFLKDKLIYTGIDITKPDFIYNSDKIQFLHESINDLDFEYNYIVSCHMLEHVVDDIGVLKSINRCLKPKGKFFIAVPEVRSYIANRLDVGHINLYTQEHLLQKLIVSGFVPFKSEVLEIIPNKNELFVACYKKE